MSNTIPFTLYWPRGMSKMMHDSICKNFGIPRHMTVNRETEVWLTGEELEGLRKLKEQGLIVLRRKK